LSPTAKFEVIKKIVVRYRTAIKKYKTPILDEFCAICGYSRKYAIWKLNHYDFNKLKTKPGKPSRYNKPRVLEALKQIWITSNFACGKRLKAMIPYWIKFVENLDGREQKLLLTMSAATIDRLLKYYRVKLDCQRRSSTKSFADVLLVMLFNPVIPILSVVDCIRKDPPNNPACPLAYLKLPA